VKFLEITLFFVKIKRKIAHFWGFGCSWIEITYACTILPYQHMLVYAWLGIYSCLWYAASLGGPLTPKLTPNLPSNLLRIKIFVKKFFDRKFFEKRKIEKFSVFG
jgi:hypothetical protein